MRKILFRIDSLNKEGYETSEDKIRKFEEYKELLVKDGEEIVNEKEVRTKRGKMVEITLK